MSSVSLDLSTRYNTQNNTKNTPEIIVEISQDQYASRIGIVKNEAIDAVNWQDILFTNRAKPTFTNRRGIAKLCPHLESSSNRKNAGPSQKMSHNIPIIRMPPPEFINLFISNFNLAYPFFIILIIKYSLNAT
jgi:hypothetical protein